MLVWHRRAGKDFYGMDTAREEAEAHVGTYWHLYPTHVQARRAIWNGIDKRGFRFIDLAFPNRTTTRQQDMQVVLPNGAMWQLCGSDKFNSLVGANVRGVVFSEWALCDPRAWDYVRPIIRENGGWALFITTYRGRNHAYRMFQRLKDNPEWYCDLRTIDDTTDELGRRIITDADIEAERDEGMSEALIQQEYYCNPVAAQEGAVYGKQVAALLEAGRLMPVVYDRSLPVLASWSLEPSEHTVAFFQRRGNETRLIGSESYPFESLADAIQLSRDRFPWKYISRDILPADATSEAVLSFEELGAVTELAPELEDNYEPTRDTIAKLYIDNDVRQFTDGEDNNVRMLDALNGYRFARAEGGQSFLHSTVNTWERHYARTLETFAAWQHDEPLSADGWHPAPSTEQLDRATI